MLHRRRAGCRPTGRSPRRRTDIGAALPLDLRLLLGRQVGVPAEPLQHRIGELGIAVLDLRASTTRSRSASSVSPLRSRPKRGRKVPPPSFTCEIGVVEDMRAGMAHLAACPSTARAGRNSRRRYRRALRGAQRHDVELVLVRHMQLQPLGRLAGIAGRPAAAVDLAQQGFGRRLVPILPLKTILMLEHLAGEAAAICAPVRRT
jgi:hypothetical protein